MRDNGTQEIPICYKAMLSLHGISAKRLQNIQQKLVKDGHVGEDCRGRHSNRPNKLDEETTNAVYTHIRSFKGRQSHYSLHKSKKIYLPEDLNVKKMFQMFKELYPTKSISYESYRSIFVNKFNISFGYPRSDTCSHCDEYKAKKSDPSQASNVSALDMNNQLHLKKAEAFYQRKRSERKRAQKHRHIEAIAMDYQKNLPLPNISTNDVYYKRQLSFYLFNIHVLASGEALFYTYTETAAKKGSDEVASILFHYILNELNPEVQELVIFCDSCCGQNKNYTLFRMLHYIVHKVGRLQCVKMVFPIRGHSYMECDRNMGLINSKAFVELPSGWDDHIRNARVKPSPFKVISCEDQTIFRSWSHHLKDYYIPKCPFESRPVRELVIKKEEPRMIDHRDAYNGGFISSVVVPTKKKQTIKKGKAVTKKSKNAGNAVRVLPDLPSGQFELPNLKYENRIPINIKKYQNLQDLKRFCSVEAQIYFENLQCN